MHRARWILLGALAIAWHAPVHAQHAANVVASPPAHQVAMAGDGSASSMSPWVSTPRAGVGTQAPSATARASTPTQPGPASLLDACTIQRFSTGWVVADCNTYRVEIQAGYAARRGGSFLASVGVDRIASLSDSPSNAFDTRAALPIPGVTEAREVVVRRPRPSLFGTDRDPNGQPTHRGLYAQVGTPRSGRVGVLCQSLEATFERARCVEVIREVATRGVLGGPMRPGPVRVSGVALPSARHCWAPAPEEIYCLNDGGTSWHDGPPEIVRDHEAHVAATFRSMVPDAPVERTERPCRIGSMEATCARTVLIGQGGVHPTLHTAYVSRGADATIIWCQQTSDPAPPSTCRFLLGM